MYAARLKTELWVAAQVRICDRDFIPIAVRRKGDPDAGVVLLKLNRLDRGCEVLTQIRTPDGTLGWMRGLTPVPVVEAEAEAYIARQLERDPDLWVIEIEDRNDKYQLDGELV